MTLQQLKYFIAAADTLNFTKAAEKCFISQTAISLQIKALEQEIGTSLFDRDLHHVNLTASGAVFAQEVRQILSKTEEAVKLAQTVQQGINGILTIGFVKGYEQTLFTETIRSFREAYPNVQLRFLRENSTVLHHKLLEGEIDVSFNVKPYAHTYSELQHLFLCKYPLRVILYPDHPLAGRKRLTRAELEGYDQIIMQPEGTPNEEAEELILSFDRAGYVPKIILREKDSDMLLFQVSIGQGIAVMPEYMMRFFNDAKNLRLVPLYEANGEVESVDFEAAWSPENSNPVLSTFLGWVKHLNYDMVH